MIYIRSVLFNVFFMISTALVLLVCSPLLLSSSRYWAQTGTRTWWKVTLWGAKHIAGITYKIIGAERIAPSPCLIASKHHSAWDTVILGVLFPNATVVIKHELLKVPVMSWYFRRLNSIPIDRSQGLAAIKTLVAKAKDEVAQGRDVFIYPEGTRVDPSANVPFQPGVAALYQSLNLPVVPVATNAGVFWGRRSFLKTPGVIIVEVLPTIEPGLDRKVFMKKLEVAINQRSTELCEQALIGIGHA